MLHDPQFRVRFEREAKTIAMLEHPAIVPVYDFGEEDGQPYFVMRCMTGGSLSDRLKQGPIPVAEAARILQRLAPALDEAHKRQIIHRDLKPGNILFDQNNEPYLSDFGIAKLAGGQSNVTGSAIVGTPAYMSPEQAQGEGVDGRSDIYGLGVIFFEMLTGRQPYEGDTPMSVVVKHITAPTPHILDVRPDLPADLEPVIERAMAKNRDERFAKATDFAAALSAVARGEKPDLKTVPHMAAPTAPALPKAEPGATVVRPHPGAQVPAPGGKPKRTGLWVGLGTLAILLGIAAVLAVVYFFVLNPGSPATPDATPTTAATRTPASETTELTEAPLVTDTPPPPTEASSPTPESATVIGGADQIAFTNGGNIWIMGVDGGGLHQLTTDGALKTGLQWSPNGSHIIYVSGKSVQSVDAVTGEVSQIAQFPPASSLEAFEISPDGSQVAIVISRELYVVPYDPEALRQARSRTDLIAMNGRFTYTERGVTGVRWSNDGQRLAVRFIDAGAGQQIELVRVYDISDNSSTGLRGLDLFPAQRFSMSGYDTNPTIPSFDWDGETLFVLNSNIRNGGFGNLYGYDYVTHNYDPLIPLSGCCYINARWSPDGDYLLFAYQDMGQGSASRTQLYYIPYTTIGTGATYSPIPVPDDFFANPREIPQLAPRPARGR
jgi:serine/threonine-protein kinase